VSIGRMIAWPIGVCLCLLSVASIVMECAQLIATADALQGQHLAPALGESCLGGNDSACEAYPVAKDIDAMHNDPGSGGPPYTMLAIVFGFFGLWTVLYLASTRNQRGLRAVVFEDRGSASVVGAFLCVGIAVVVFAACVWVVAWCPSCLSSAQSEPSGAWVSLGPAHVVHGAGGEELSCRPMLVVVNGYATATGGEKCGLVSAELAVGGSTVGVSK
jgi:hypothetical protein